MRIAQLCADRGIAAGSTKGAAQHLRGIAAGLTRLGDDVTTYTARPPEGEFPVQVHALADFEVATAHTFDVIYERYSLGHCHGLAIARDARRRFVLEVNSPLVAEAQAHRPDTVPDDASESEAYLLANADLVITVSSGLTKWASSKRNGPTMTLTNGFEPAWFSEPDRDNPTYDLVFIGHPKPWHGADRLPSLLRALADAGTTATLLVIGGGPGADQLIAAAAGLGVADQITVTGALHPEQATAMLAEAAIGIAPYPTHDNFYFCPLKVIDYLAAGLPIISTDQGDIAELVGDAGAVVPPDDDQALLSAVEELLGDRARRVRFGQNGRRRALAGHTWDHVAERAHNAIAPLLAVDTHGVRQWR